MTSQADALEVMTLVAACHRRTAPRLDDEEAELATALIWAELFSVYNLELPDLLAAVKKRALSEAEAPEPAEIIRVAREIRAERTQRESGAERRAREDRQDAALAERGALSIQRSSDGHGAALPRAAGTEYFQTRLAETIGGFGKDIPDA